ncbi:hypothetical protein, partial [Escherichia coli]|uniref:hypothetical protein n=1 Tax=Escherichia coli TaxID=562 RepID=UPI003F685E97
RGCVAAPLSHALRSDDADTPPGRLSRPGDLAGRPPPDEFPPRNMQTSKGLRALGYNVRIGV